MNKKINLVIATFFISYSIVIGQLAKLDFTINNFLHQKSQFSYLNQVDTKGAFLEPTVTFGQHYILTKEKEINSKFSLKFGLGVGYTRIAYRRFRSEAFLSVGFEDEFIEKRGVAANTMFFAPVSILYNLYKKNKSVVNFNINVNSIFALRTRVGFSSNSMSKKVYTAVVVINNENRPDFTIGAGIDYRRQILDSGFWWKVGLNLNYALTTYYTGNATLFGDDENLDIEIENKLHHVGVAVGIIKSLE